jgi:hypothetical protein
VIISIDFGKIIEVPLNEVWLGESTYFTPWLSQNMNVLSEKLGTNLNIEDTHIATEVSAGNFSADIVAVDAATNRKIVIENQYATTDHRHLGQIITYSSILKASIVIWIAETIRDEHKQAIDFLNQNLKETLQIFALEASVIRIDNSKHAFDFKVVCRPSLASSLGMESTSETSEVNEKYRRYFQIHIDKLRTENFTYARVRFC